MDQETKDQLQSMLDQTKTIFKMNDEYQTDENRQLAHLDAAATKAYASCQIALQLDRIATILEEMYKSPSR
jgi:hypothetical protein